MAALEPKYLTPVELKLSPDGKTIYVVCKDSDSVLAVTLPDGKVKARVKVGHKPKGIALSPDGKQRRVSHSSSAGSQ